MLEWGTPAHAWKQGRRAPYEKRRDGGTHVMGVNSGDYDAAAIASDVLHRMGERGR